MADVLYSARYPFTSSARELIAARKISLERIDSVTLEHGRRRVESALARGEIGKFLDVGPAAELEVASYAVARLLVALLKSKYYIARYAVAEAKRASGYLRNDSDENLVSVAKEVGVHGGAAGELTYSMNVVDYLKNAPRAVEYRLINQKLRSGVVELTRHEFARVVEEAIRLGIEESMLNLNVNAKNVPMPIRNVASELQKEIGTKIPTTTVKFEGGAIAPCIQKIVSSLEAHQNAPHTARWVLAVYMLNRGVSEDDIVKLYIPAPDFNERITRYQIQHAKKRGYKMPSTDAMRTYGLACEECERGIPLNKQGMKK